MDYVREQLELQRSAFGVDPPSLTGEARVEYVRANVLAAIKELTEVLDKVDGWKYWQTERSHAGEFRADDGHNDYGVAYIGECVDVLHFIFNLVNTAGCNDRELEREFRGKQQENARRQREGYDGNGGR